MRVRKNPKGQWLYDFTFEGKRFRVITGLSREETKDAMHEHFRRLKREGFGIASRAPAGTVLFESFAEEFIENYSRANRRPQTVRSHQNSIERLKTWFKGVELRAITTERIDQYKVSRAKEVSPASVNRELACLKKMFSQAVDWGRAAANPAARVKMFKEYAPKERILSTDEIRRLLAAACSHLKPILIIALNTGMRLREILTLKWENVNFAQSQILIEERISKSRRARKVPMNPAVTEALKAIPRKGQIVFFNEDTGQGFNSVRTAFLSACRRAKRDPADSADPGIQGVRFHDLRHTAATKMLEAGVDIVTVSKILGHSSIEITYQRYCHPTPENMQHAVDRLGILYGMTASLGNNPDTNTAVRSGSTAEIIAISAG